MPRRDRVVLAALAVHAGEAVAAERLADALWGDQPPSSWAKVVQGCIVRLRRKLGADAIETVQYGYRLLVPADDVDVLRFARMLARGRELLDLGQPDRARQVLGDALALWRGPALVDLEEWGAGRAEARRLEELRFDAEELGLEAALRLGRHREVLGAARAQVEEVPLRERRWWLLALSQYQAGQQAEALRTLHDVRTLLSRELGLDPGPDLVALEGAILRHDPALLADAVRPDPRPTCPYRGLVPYDLADAEDFYGRDRDVAACRNRLAQTGAVTVVGPSGSGKSSLIRAGLAAGLRRDGRRVVVITPGAHPMDLLSGASGSGKAPVLVVDQCEEAVGLSEDPAERARFFTALTEYAERAPLIVAVRADRLGDLSAHAGFTRLVERSLFLLNPMTANDLRDAIEGPARGAGLRVEAGLVDLLVREVEGEPGALPLLSHALRATWERREGQTLTVAGYRDTGGVRGAVAHTAETVYERIPADQRPALRDLLLRLIAPNPEGDPIRGRLPRRLLSGTPDNDRLIETLIAARLVTSDDGVVELAHEALVRAWPRLQDWLDEDAEGQRVLRHLVMSADSWDSMGRPDSELYRGPRLTAALQWRNSARSELTPTEADFLAGAERLERDELTAARASAEDQRRVSRRLRAVAFGLAVLLLVVTGLGALAMSLWRRAGGLEDESESRALAGEVAALTETKPRVAMLLAATAYALADTDEASVSLVRTADFFRDVDTIIEGDFHDVEFSPTDSDRLVGVEASRVVLWDVARGSPDGEVAGTGYTSAAFSPDGRTIALAGLRSLDLWKPGRKPEVLARLQPGLGPSGLRFSPDGEHVAGCIRLRYLRVWSVLDPEDVQTIQMQLTCKFGFTDHGKRVVYVAPDGSTLNTRDIASGRDVDQTRVPIPQDQDLTQVGRATIDSLTVTPDGRTALIGTTSTDEIIWWDLRKRAPVNPAPIPMTVQPSSFDATGDLAVTAPPISLVDMRHRVPLRTYWARSGLDEVTLSADGSRIATVLGGSIVTIDVGSGSGVPARPSTAAMIDEDRLVTASFGGAHDLLSVWNRDAPRNSATRLFDGAADGARDSGALSSDGTLLAHVNRRKQVVVWDVLNQEPLPGTFSGRYQAGSVFAFDPTAKFLAMTTGRSLVVWEVETHAIVSRIPIPPGTIGISLSRDARYIGVLGSSFRAVVWGRESRERVTSLPSEGVRGMAFSPDGRSLAMSVRGDIQIWDVEREIMSPFGSGSTPLTFSPNGRLLAVQNRQLSRTGDAPIEIEIRALDEGRLLGAVTQRQQPIFVQFTPDSTELLVGDGETVSFHRFDRVWALGHLCALAGKPLTSEEWNTYLEGFSYLNACR